MTLQKLLARASSADVREQQATAPRVSSYSLWTSQILGFGDKTMLTKNHVNTQRSSL